MNETHNIEDLLALKMAEHRCSEQHLFIQMLMDKEKKKLELWEKLKFHVLGWGAVTAIVYVSKVGIEQLRLVLGL